MLYKDEEGVAARAVPGIIIHACDIVLQTLKGYRAVFIFM
jgi:hypothetical protein